MICASGSSARLTGLAGADVGGVGVGVGAGDVGAVGVCEKLGWRVWVCVGVAEEKEEEGDCCTLLVLPLRGGVVVGCFVAGGPVTFTLLWAVGDTDGEFPLGGESVDKSLVRICEGWNLFG